MTVRERRTKLDWAQEVAALLEGRYARCEQVTLVLDNLDTHVPAALYDAFGAERGERLLDRIEFRYTPKHWSWLNVTECELSCLARQCLRGRRIGELEKLRSWRQSAPARRELAHDRGRCPLQTQVRLS